MNQTVGFSDHHMDLPSATSSSMAPLTWEKHHCTSLFPPPAPAQNTQHQLTSDNFTRVSLVLTKIKIHSQESEATGNITSVIRDHCCRQALTTVSTLSRFVEERDNFSLRCQWHTVASWGYPSLLVSLRWLTTTGETHILCRTGLRLQDKN